MNQEIASFEELKAAYSQPGITSQEKEELICLMQKYLQSICDSDTVKGLDGNIYSTSSNNVEELYAIYGTMRLRASQNKMTEAGNDARQAAFKQYKYGPGNQYPESE